VSEILPLAITMMVGPQIITSFVLAAGDDVIKPSLAFVIAVGIATLAGCLIFAQVAGLFHLHDSHSHPTKSALRIQTAIVIVLALLALRTYRNRATAKLPGWMTRLMQATPKMAFLTGIVLIGAMPTDLMIMSTVGINLESHDHRDPLIPFVLLTMLVAALPLIAYVMFRKRAQVVMPKVRAWMENNSWVVSIGAYAIFIALLWP
jgi:hypothetical protein